MAVGLTRPDAGTISVFGIDVERDPIGAKAITAWLPDEPMLYDKLTPLEYLAFVSGLWRMDPHHAAAEAERLLQWLELWEERNTPYEGFSRGMKQKVALAGALICAWALSPPLIWSTGSRGGAPLRVSRSF